MSLVNTLTRGLIYPDGEHSVSNIVGGWHKYGNYWISVRLTNLRVYLSHLPAYICSRLGFIWAKKLIGSALGYSHCYHCEMPWCYVEHESIKFSEDSGMFPLCKTCFSILEPGQIGVYILELVSEWIQINERYSLPWDKAQTPEEVVEAANAEVRRMKGLK